MTVISDGRFIYRYLCFIEKAYDNRSMIDKSSVYIVAVSGGVDSMMLLHWLHAMYPDTQFVIAHVDHGIREDSHQDALLVRQYADQLGIQYEMTELRLGAISGEAEARKKRYAFLQSIADKYNARAILTAHHQDDVLETLFINLLRGTGRKGLTSLKSTDGVIRPLLHMPKSSIYEYAREHNVPWREDSTNTNTKYLRNKIRHQVVPKMTTEQREKLLQLHAATADLNEKIDKELRAATKRGLHKGQPVLNRGWFIKLPHYVATEVMRQLFEDFGVTEIDKKSIEKAVIAIKALPAGKTIQLSGAEILLTKRSARFKRRSKTERN